MDRSSFFWLIGLTLAVFAVYGSSLNYPFFWVDPIDIGLAGSRSIPTIFTNSQGYLYYRPFAFILWKLLYALEGRFDPFAFHLVHVFTHLINTWLMFALAKRLLKATRSRIAPQYLAPQHLAGLAALCFAWYPGNHQTVTWVVSPQVQATAFLLASAILYYDGRTQGQRKKIWLSLLCIALALPFQENAVSFGFVIAALEGLITLRTLKGVPGFGNLRKVEWWPLAHIGLCLAFALLWVIIPKDPDSAIARFEPAAGWYLLQGLIWPVAGAVGPWRTWFASMSNPAWQPLIIVAPITLIFLFVAYRYARRLALPLLGLVWFAVMVLPIWATRGFSYVGVSPRIFYVGSGGVVLIWIGLLTIDLKSARANRLWHGALVFLVCAIVLQSAAFLGVRKTLHDDTLPAIWDVVNTGEAAGSNANLLYVNVPDQITPYLREYPIGWFRAILMPVSVDLGQFVELQTGVRLKTQSITVPALANLGNYPYQVDMRGGPVDQPQLDAAIRAADTVFFTEYQPDGRVHIVEAGSVTTNTTASHQATFDSHLGLVEATIKPELDRTQITLVWDCMDQIDPQATVFVHAIDASGQLAAQGDGDPMRNLFPLSECKPGERIRDMRYIVLPVGTFTLKVGVYHQGTQARLKAIDNNNQPIPDNAATIGQITQ